MRLWKVVRVKDGKYLSAIKSSYEIEYKINEYTRPEIGKLFAFRFPESAFVFLKNRNKDNPKDNFEVWTCHCVNPIYNTTRILYNININNYCKMYWKNRESVPTSMTGISPKDTILCNSIKLTEKV